MNDQSSSGVFLLVGFACVAGGIITGCNNVIILGALMMAIGALEGVSVK